jgi:hypothetical protein
MISTATAPPAHFGRRRRNAVFSFGGIKRWGTTLASAPIQLATKLQGLQQRAADLAPLPSFGLLKLI